MASPGEFLAYLRKSRSLLAPLISITDPSVSELISFLEPDFLIVDMEHSVIDVPALQNVIMAAKPMKVMARIRGLEKNEIKKVLDTGVAGIIIPGIERVEKVEEAMSYSRIAPSGTRGVGPGRASKYGYQFREYIKQSGNQAIIIQIETRKAFESLDDILSVSGLEGCFIGPVDLTTALDLEFSWKSREFLEVVDRILSAAAKRNLVTGIYSPLGNPDPSPILSRGFNFIMFGTDREAIQLKYLESLRTFREKIAKTQ